MSAPSLSEHLALVAAVDPDEGGAFPLCARPSPGRAETDAEPTTPVAVALALLREAQAAGAGAALGVRWVVADGGYSSRPTGRKRPCDGCFDRHAPARLACTPWPEEGLDLYHGVLLYSTDTELAPPQLVRLYRARFPIEFVFRDAKQHLGLHDGQARAQAKLHCHFNLVFATYFWMRLQARAAGDGPRDRFSLYQIKCHNHEWEMYQRFEAWSAAGRNGTQSQAADHGLPADHPWHRAPPLATGLPGP